jgi:hypothetical protein
MDSHRLITLAGHQGYGKQNALVDELFLNYFCQGKYIGDKWVWIKPVDYTIVLIISFILHSFYHRHLYFCIINRIMYEEKILWGITYPLNLNWANFSCKIYIYYYQVTHIPTGNVTLLRVNLTLSLPQIETCFWVEYFTTLAKLIFSILSSELKHFQQILYKKFT